MLVAGLSGFWLLVFWGILFKFLKKQVHPFEVLEKLSIPVTEHNSGKEHFEMLFKVAGRVAGGGHLGLIVMHLNSSSWALVPTKFVELGNALV